jgi:hypothetical protein
MILDKRGISAAGGSDINPSEVDDVTKVVNN